MSSGEDTRSTSRPAYFIWNLAKGRRSKDTRGLENLQRNGGMFLYTYLRPTYLGTCLIVICNNSSIDSIPTFPCSSDASREAFAQSYWLDIFIWTACACGLTHDGRWRGLGFKWWVFSALHFASSFLVRLGSTDTRAMIRRQQRHPLFSHRYCTYYIRMSRW